jgi:Na+-driven multidrug efflux pump
LDIFVILNITRDLAEAKIAMMLTLIRQVFVLLPLLLVFPGWFGLKGIWFASPVADTISATLVAFFLVREWKKLNQMISDFGLPISDLKAMNDNE